MKTHLALIVLALGLAHAEPPPNLPAPVASFGAAATPEGEVFIYGGHAGKRHRYNREDVNGELHSWKTGLTAWESLGKDEPAQGASLIALPGKVLRIGGMAARNAREDTQDLWSSETAASFDVKTKTWTQLPKLPERRSSHDSVVIGETLYVIGGWTLAGGKSSAPDPVWLGTYLTLDLSKPDAQWQSHPQPFKRRALAVQAIGTKLYAIGGMSDGDEPVTNVDVLDTTTGQWSPSTALPEEKLGGFGFAAIAHEGRLFASGVAGELLELVDGQWVSITKLAHPRFFHRFVPGGSHKLIAIGGESRKGEKAPPEVIEIPAAGKVLPTEEKKTASLPASPLPVWPENVPAAEADWPGYQGPRGNSTTPEVGWNTQWPAEGPPVAWRAQVGLGLASFAVVGDRAYTAGNDGQDQDTIFCLSLKNGDTLWKHTLKVPTKCHDMPVVPYGPAATISVVDGLAYFISREGDLLCLKADTGVVVWQKHLINDLGGKRPVYGYAGSPLIADGRIYLDIGGAGKSTTCLEAKTGEIVWQAGDGEAGYSTPVLARKDVLMVFKGEALELRSTEDSGLIARHETTTRDFCNCATPLIAGETIFISHTGNMGARALAWKGEKLNELWTERDLGLLFHSGLPWQQNVIVFNDQLRGGNDMRLIDLASGKARWQSKEVAKGSGVLADDGHALLLTNTGELVLAKVKADELEILSRTQALPAKSWVQPVLSHRRLLCKNNAGDVVCYDLK